MSGSEWDGQWDRQLFEQPMTVRIPARLRAHFDIYVCPTGKLPSYWIRDQLLAMPTFTPLIHLRLPHHPECPATEYRAGLFRLGWDTFRAVFESTPYKTSLPLVGSPQRSVIRTVAQTHWLHVEERWGGFAAGLAHVAQAAQLEELRLPGGSFRE